MASNFLTELSGNQFHKTQGLWVEKHVVIIRNFKPCMQDRNFSDTYNAI